MKNIVVLLFTVFLINCSSDTYNNKLEQSLFGMQNSIVLVEKKNEDIYAKFKFESENYFWGNPKRIKPWYDKSLKIKALFNERVLLIDNIINKPSKKDITLLKSSIDSLNKNLEKLLEVKNDYFDEAIRENIYDILDTNRWPVTLFQKTSNIELKAVLTTIKMDLRQVELSLLSFLNSNIDYSCCFCFYPIYGIAVPESEYIYQGDFYIADIFLATVDTIRCFQYEIDGKTYKSDIKNYLYTEKVGNIPGKITRYGRFILPSRYTDTTFYIPFKFEYEVIE